MVPLRAKKKKGGWKEETPVFFSKGETSLSPIFPLEKRGEDGDESPGRRTAQKEGKDSAPPHGL